MWLIQQLKVAPGHSAPESPRASQRWTIGRHRPPCGQRVGDCRAIGIDLLFTTTVRAPTRWGRGAWHPTSRDSQPPSVMLGVLSSLFSFLSFQSSLFTQTWSSSAILFNCNSHDHPVSVPQQTSSACLPSFHFRSFRFNTCFDLTHALVVPRWTSARGIPAVSSASPTIAPPASILQCITPCCAKLMLPRMTAEHQGQSTMYYVPRHNIDSTAVMCRPIA